MAVGDADVRIVGAKRHAYRELVDDAGLELNLRLDVELERAPNELSEADWRVYHNFLSASPTAYPLRGYGRAGTQNDRLHTRAMDMPSAMPISSYGRIRAPNELSEASTNVS